MAKKKSGSETEILQLKSRIDELEQLAENLKRSTDQAKNYLFELEKQNRELKQVQSAFDKSRQKFIDLYEFLPIGYLTLDDDGTIIEINSTCAAMLDEVRYKLYGKSFSKFIEMNSLDYYNYHISKVVSEPGSSGCKLKIRRQTSSYFDARLESRMMTDPESGKKVIYTAIIDISEMRNAESALIASNGKFRALFEHALDAIFIYDDNRVISDVNPQAMQMLGYPKNEIVGRKIENFLSPDFSTNIDDIWNELITEGFRQGVLTFLTATGDPIYVEFRAMANFFNDQHVSIMNNVTGRRIAEKQLEDYIRQLQDKNNMINRQNLELNSINQKLNESQAELIKLNNSKDKFFSIIAHDLRGPFTALIANSEETLTNYQNMDEEAIIAKFRQMHDSGVQLYKLLDNLLNWSRTQTGNIKPDYSEFDLYEIAFNNSFLFHEAAEQKRNKITLDVEQLTLLHSDYKMVNSIVRNLVSNAVKFTERGEIKIIARKTDIAEIIIEDNGVGIEDERRNIIFSLDKYVSTNGTNLEEGTGLGLILCKEFSNILGGDIYVESIKGKGSRFIVTLPDRY